MGEGKRVFSEKEASEVLGRAARLQEERGGGGSYSPGLTHDELVRIATEAGIDPENLEAAIRAASAAPTKRGFLNLVEEDERVVDAELDPKDFDVVLDVAKPARTRRHPVAQVGRTLTMQTRHKGGQYRVEVASRNGRTRLRVTSVPFLAYLMSLHPAILLAFFGGMNMAAQGDRAGATAFVLAMLMVGMLAFVALVRRGKGNTTELADLIEEKIRETTAPTRENLRAAVPLDSGLPVETRLSL